MCCLVWLCLSDKYTVGMCSVLSVLMIQRPPRSTSTDTLMHDTTFVRSWSRTRTCDCTAACAPNAARPGPGTCRSSCCWRRMRGRGVAASGRGRRHDYRWSGDRPWLVIPARPRMTPTHAPLESSTDFVVKFAHVNGSGPAPAKARFPKIGKDARRGGEG